MIRFRSFRNTDPPLLAEVWNDACTGRGSYPLRMVAALERWVFCKTYFDPAGLTVAEDDGRPVGFVLSGFGPNDSETAVDPRTGVVCALVVRHSHRRRGIGTELLHKAEFYLTTRGARELQAGPMRPLNPFGFGLYGGSDAPGFLTSDPAAGPFFEHAGYSGMNTSLVFQRKLDRTVSAGDPRFAGHRKRFDIQVLPRMAIGSWWQECVIGLLEPIEIRLDDKQTKTTAARALVWEMEGYSWRWNQPAAGVLDLHVRPDLRRQGVAKFLLTQLLRYLQEQYFGIAEIQTPEKNQAAQALFRAVGFAPVDVGRIYRRDAAARA